MSYAGLLYCPDVPADRLSQTAWDLFEQTSPGCDCVQAIC